MNYNLLATMGLQDNELLNEIIKVFEHGDNLREGTKNMEGPFNEVINKIIENDLREVVGNAQKTF